MTQQKRVEIQLSGPASNQSYRSPPNKPLPNTRLFSVARKERRGCARLYSIEYRTDETLSDFIKRLKLGIGPTWAASLLRKIVTFQEEAIYESFVQSVLGRPQKDLEGDNPFVNTGPLNYNALLTELYHSPSMFDGIPMADAIQKKYLKYPACAKSAIIVLGWRTSKTYVAMSLSALCLISILIGVLAGLVCRDANLGAAIGGGLFALLSVFGTVLALLCR